MEEREKYLLETIKKFSEELPSFPDGRIDYTNSRTAPVVNIYVFHQNELLLLHRSDKVRTYKSMWGVAGGYLDRIESPIERAKGELREELDIDMEIIEDIKVVDMVKKYDKSIDMTWLIAMVVAKLRTKPAIKLDWEHTDYHWIDPANINEYLHITGMEEVLNSKIKPQVSKR